MMVSPIMNAEVSAAAMGSQFSVHCTIVTFIGPDGKAVYFRGYFFSDPKTKQMDPFTLTLLIVLATMGGIWGTAVAGAAIADNCGAASPVEPEEEEEEGPEEHVI